MRIAVNTRFLIKNKLEGIGWFTYETMKRLTRNHPEHEFIFLFDREWDEEFIFSNNITPLKVWPPARHPYLWKYWFDYALPPVLKKLKPDAFISTDGFLSLRTNIPTLLVIHDLGFESYPEHTPALVNKYYRRFTPQYARRANRIVTVSEFSKNDIINRYKISPHKIDVVYNGANERYMPLHAEEKHSVRQQYTNGDGYFLYVGSIHPRKNIDKLLMAFDALKSETASPLKLVLAGRMAWKTEETKAIYESMQHKDAVVFTGHLELDALVKITASAHALIFPSLFEGFGIPVVEARYCNVPVICSDKSSIPEVAGEHAIYFDPAYVEDIKIGMMRFLERQENGKLNTQDDSQLARKLFHWNRSAELLMGSLLKMMKSVGSLKHIPAH
jgi:glycosyltransferase involved in cell wall biosynthesis